MEKVNELLQIFPTPVHISKYEKDITEELKFVKNLEYQLNGGNTGPNGNYKSDNTYVLKGCEILPGVFTKTSGILSIKTKKKN